MVYTVWCAVCAVCKMCVVFLLMMQQQRNIHKQKVQVHPRELLSENQIFSL